MAQTVRPPFKRGYMACDTCKERKVKCDIGPPDNPGPPPCRRCRRESRRCVFTAPARGRRSVPSVVNAQPADIQTPPDSTIISVSTQPTQELQTPPVRTPLASLDSFVRRPTTTSYDVISVLYGADGHNVASTCSSSGAAQVFEAPSTTPQQDAEVLQVWSNFDIVRKGLITASEARALVDYFRDNLMPFTPLISAQFRDAAEHKQLLEEEPILAMAILTISSQYMHFDGPGAQLRGYSVHAVLWEGLQALIQHMIFGQEHVFGVFCGPSINARPLDSTHRICPPLGGLRTLSACEALMLLTEWNPRVIYLPPRHQHEILVSDIERQKHRHGVTTAKDPARFEGLDPVWRSDRLIWSFLGNVYTLAVELGIFDDADPTMFGTRETREEIWKDPSYRQRAARLKTLLPVYLAHASSRMGRISLIANHESFYNASLKDETLASWAWVATTLRQVNRSFFRSRAHLSAIVANGEYAHKFDEVNPILKDCKKKIDNAKLSKPMRVILLLEYYSVFVSTCSVAFLALTSHPDENTLGRHPRTRSEAKSIVKQGVVAATAALRLVVDEILPDSTLKYVPIRTYHRVVNCAVAMWKALTLPSLLGSDEFASAFALLDRTAKALITCVVDEVHMANRIGASLQRLVQQLRDKAADTGVRADEQSTSAGISRLARTPSTRLYPPHASLLHGPDPAAEPKAAHGPSNVAIEPALQTRPSYGQSTDPSAGDDSLVPPHGNTSHALPSYLPLSANDSGAYGLSDSSGQEFDYNTMPWQTFENETYNLFSGTIFELGQMDYMMQ